MTRFLRDSLLALSFATAALTAVPAQAGPFAVTFDTSAVAGQTGSVDFQWNLGTIDPSLTAAVSGLAGAVLTDPPTLLFGHASGSLASGATLSFAATDAFNYVYQTLTFGSSLTFVLNLPDTAPNLGVTPSDFVVSLFDAALNPALPTTSPDGAALVFSLAPGAGPVLTAYSAANVAAIPEPETLALMLVGLTGLLLRARRR